MSERILVVDDDPDILQFVRLNLELDGFTVELAGVARRRSRRPPHRHPT